MRGAPREGGAPLGGRGAPPCQRAAVLEAIDAAAAGSPTVFPTDQRVRWPMTIRHAQPCASLVKKPVESQIPPEAAANRGDEAALGALPIGPKVSTRRTPRMPTLLG